MFHKNLTFPFLPDPLFLSLSSSTESLVDLRIRTLQQIRPCTAHHKPLRTISIPPHVRHTGTMP